MKPLDPCFFITWCRIAGRLVVCGVDMLSWKLGWGKLDLFTGREHEVFWAGRVKILRRGIQRFRGIKWSSECINRYLSFGILSATLAASSLLCFWSFFFLFCWQFEINSPLARNRFLPYTTTSNSRVEHRRRRRRRCCVVNGWRRVHRYNGDREHFNSWTDELIITCKCTPSGISNKALSCSRVVCHIIALVLRAARSLARSTALTESTFFPTTDV